MALTMVDTSRPVTGGVDTHLDVNVAAALDGIGGLLGVEQFPTSPAGNKALLVWLKTFGTIARVGVEGTGSYGAPLARYLRRAGVEVVEVDRPNRQERRRKGKTDVIDAIEAARAAQGERQLGSAKTRDGNMEAIRALVVAKRSAKSTKIKTPQPDPPSRLHRPRGDPPVPARPHPPDGGQAGGGHASPGRQRPGRLRHQDRPARSGPAGAGPRRRDRPASTGCSPSCSSDGHEDLLSLYGVGIDSAAALLVTAGDNPDRLRSEAVLGPTVRCRPHRSLLGQGRPYCDSTPAVTAKPTPPCGTSSITRMSSDPRTRLYVERRSKEGRSKKEIIRVLKRYVAREVYYYLTPPLSTPDLAAGLTRESADTPNRVVLRTIRRPAANPLATISSARAMLAY